MAVHELEQPWLPSSEGIVEWGADFHALMLGDRLRMTAFRAAVREVVRPGSVVLDLPRQGLSYDIELPEQVDVVISETLGNLADNESCVPILTDARERFLAADGVMIPSQVESYLVPVSSVRADDVRDPPGRRVHRLQGLLHSEPVTVGEVTADQAKTCPQRSKGRGG